MTGFARVTVRHPLPFDIVGDTFRLCGLGVANEGVVGVAAVKDNNGTVLATVAPMFVANTGFNFTLYDFAVNVGTPTTPQGTLVVEADNPSGLPENDFTVTVPLTFGRTLLDGASYGGFTIHKVVSGDTLSGLAQHFYQHAGLWPRLFVANRDRISNPDVIRIGQVLRIPLSGA